MNSKTFESLFEDVLKSISHPRLFKSERGYQGELLGNLKAQLHHTDLPKGWLLEQEYQKTFEAHGLTIRPDIILHVPFDASQHSNRKEDNFVVIQIKLNASKADALKDFGDLDKMLGVLEYPFGIFLNVGSSETWSYLYDGKFPEKLRFYAVNLSEKRVEIYKSNAPHQYQK